MNIQQIIISAAFTLMGSVLTYFLSLRKINAETEKVKINSDTEINKIREESKKELEKIKAESLKEIEKIKTEHEEYRKNKKNDSKLNTKEQTETMQNKLAMNFIQNMLENPEKADKQIEALKKMEKKFTNNKNKKKH